jgi:hypothetical protein
MLLRETPISRGVFRENCAARVASCCGFARFQSWPEGTKPKGENAMSSSRVPERGRVTAVYPDDFGPELQAELSALADIESRYEQARGSVASRADSEFLKLKLTRELEKRHRQDRGPHVQRLAELHTRLVWLTLFQGLRAKH